jgi:hypothetical protein
MDSKSDAVWHRKKENGEYTRKTNPSGVFQGSGKSFGVSEII